VLGIFILFFLLFLVFNFFYELLRIFFLMSYIISVESYVPCVLVFGIPDLVLSWRTRIEEIEFLLLMKSIEIKTRLHRQ
jgi:hypothetical protein